MLVPSFRLCASVLQQNRHPCRSSDLQLLSSVICSSRPRMKAAAGLRTAAFIRTPLQLILLQVLHQTLVDQPLFFLNFQAQTTIGELKAQLDLLKASEESPQSDTEDVAQLKVGLSGFKAISDLSIPVWDGVVTSPAAAVWYRSAWRRRKRCPKTWAKQPPNSSNFSKPLRSS